MADLQTLTDYLVDFGAKDVPHTEKTYFAHAMSVYADIKKWQVDDAVCRAALFHSIYGTEGFTTLTLEIERRDELRELIGDRAEKLAYANCAMDRESFYKLVHEVRDRYQIPDRLTEGMIELSAAEFDDLMRLHLCDCRHQSFFHLKTALLRLKFHLLVLW